METDAIKRLINSVIRRCAGVRIIMSGGSGPEGSSDHCEHRHSDLASDSEALLLREIAIDARDELAAIETVEERDEADKMGDSITHSFGGRGGDLDTVTVPESWTRPGGIQRLIDLAQQRLPGGGGGRYDHRPTEHDIMKEAIWSAAFELNAMEAENAANNSLRILLRLAASALWDEDEDPSDKKLAAQIDDALSNFDCHYINGATIVAPVREISSLSKSTEGVVVDRKLLRKIEWGYGTRLPEDIPADGVARGGGSGCCPACGGREVHADSCWLGNELKDTQ